MFEVLQSHRAAFVELSTKQDQHTATLGQHTTTLAEHGDMLREILRRLDAA